MAKIQSFMYAANVIQELPRDASTQIQPQTHIIAPLQIIVPLFIPSTYSFFIVFSLRDFDTTTAHNIKIQFCDPDEKILVETEAAVPVIPENPIAEVSDEYKGFSSSIGLQNTIFRQTGAYKTNVIFDSEKIGSYEIYVARRKP